MYTSCETHRTKVTKLPFYTPFKTILMNCMSSRTLNSFSTHKNKQGDPWRRAKTRVRVGSEGWLVDRWVSQNPKETN